MLISLRKLQKLYKKKIKFKKLTNLVVINTKLTRYNNNIKYKGKNQLRLPKFLIRKEKINEDK